MKDRRANGKTHDKQDKWICRQCGKKFTPARSWQAYCSRECGWKYRGDRRAERVREALAQMEASSGT